MDIKGKSQELKGYSIESLRSKRINEIEEDLKEVKLEMTLLEKSRAKARNINNDDRARHLTQEMTPLRQKKRKLEEELTLLQKKEAKSIQQKRTKANPTKSGNTSSSSDTFASSHTIDTILKKRQDAQQKECDVVIISDDTPPEKQVAASIEDHHKISVSQNQDDKNNNEEIMMTSQQNVTCQDISRESQNDNTENFL